MPATNQAFQCDPAPGHRKGLVVIFDNGMQHMQQGVPEGAALQLQPGFPVTLALYGEFSDVSPVVQQYARGAVFDVPADNHSLRGDPCPGIQKQLCVMIGGGRNGLNEVVFAREGSVLEVRLGGRVHAHDQCCVV